jgi:hypothetical protein
VSVPWSEDAPDLAKDPEFVPFTHRYGTASLDDVEAWPETLTQHWRTRHVKGVPPTEPDRLLRCSCPGWTNDARQIDCGERATAEDLLCPHCRRWCWAYYEQDQVRGRVSFLALLGQSPRREQ